MSNGLKFRFNPCMLELKHAFGTASGIRSSTPAVLTEMEWEGITGYGEASMPPYLGESHRTVIEFLSGLRLGQFHDPFQMEEILTYVDSLAEGNAAAKASVDIALHDLVGKCLGQPWYKIWGYDPGKTPDTSYTIGIDSLTMIREKIQEASEYRILKIKLGGGSDRQIIQTIRTLTDVPLCVDVNQGWTDRYMALDMIHWLSGQGVCLVEQPLPRQQVDDMAWITERSPIPTIADESVQRSADVLRAYGIFSGVNIKLMKSGGMREAHKMLNLAKSLGMKTMIGCMTETSCAISAAAQLSPVVDRADLDGALLIKNDLFRGTEFKNGKIILKNRPGIGVEKKAAVSE